MFPTPRDPECSTTHTRSSSSKLTSMKWFPPPSVPSCDPILCFALSGAAFLSGSGLALSHARASDVASSWPLNPAGTAAEIASRAGARSSGSCDAVCSVRMAAIPHPRSTPTQAGRIAASVGMTVPMVEPTPT